MRHIQIGRYLKVTVAYRVLSVNVPIILLFETYLLLRHIQIGRQIKVTVSYRGLNCYC